MKKLLEILDGFICKYIGISKQEIIPDILNRTGNQLIVKNTESFKRHIYSQKLGRFLSAHINQINEGTKQKMGISIGAALAKDLVISFENATLKKE